MTVVPNPCRFGADTGGPSRSVQLMVRASPSVAQKTSTRPLSVESAPYFPALVASSWSASPTACALAPFQTQLWAIQDDTRTNEIGEMRKLSADEVLDLDSSPLVPNEEFLIGRQRLDAFGEPFNEIFGISCGGLASDCLYDAEDVLGAMIDLAHEEVLPFLTLLAFCNVRDCAGEAHDPSLPANALEISKPMSLYPSDFTILPLDPVLMRVGFWIGGIEPRHAARPKQFHIVRMHPLVDLLNRHLVGDDIENFLKARIPRDHAVDRIILPRPEPGCIE